MLDSKSYVCFELYAVNSKAKTHFITEVIILKMEDNCQYTTVLFEKLNYICAGQKPVVGSSLWLHLDTWISNIGILWISNPPDTFFKKKYFNHIDFN